MQDNKTTLLLGDNLETLKQLADNSVDACVTDPPYGISFMSRSWDYDVPKVELWREVLRVLKPGAHLLSFGGTRTYHRMVVAIEDAGFEIRDQVMWIYGSGFPKSQDVSKAIDKQAGAVRSEVVGQTQRTFSDNPTSGSPKGISLAGDSIFGIGVANESFSRDILAPATAAAELWQGWGTALKPANEPIVLARKPLERGLTVAANCLKWGTGAINVDASRIASEMPIPRGGKADGSSVANNHGGWDRPWMKDPEKQKEAQKNAEQRFAKAETLGRFPANVLFCEQAAAVLDEQSGVSKSQVRKISATEDTAIKNQVYGKGYVRQEGGQSDSGGASRFFYVAKSSKSERNQGLEGMPEKDAPGSKRSTPAEGRSSALGAPRANHHPTVKPIKLMEYLVRMITPPGGTCLDPFAGSGSTGVACANLGFEFIGCELSPEYMEIAKRRIEYAEGNI